MEGHSLQDNSGHPGGIYLLHRLRRGTDKDKFMLLKGVGYGIMSNKKCKYCIIPSHEDSFSMNSGQCRFTEVLSHRRCRLCDLFDPYESFANSEISLFMSRAMRRLVKW